MPASTKGLDEIVIDIAPGYSPTADPSTYVWEYAGPRRTGSDLVITAGRDDEASKVEAGSLTAVMDDRDGRLSPRNVLGQWYGTLRRGTPIQVRWPRTTDTFTRTTSNGFGTNDDGYTWLGGSQSVMSTDGTRAVIQLPSNNASYQRLIGAGSPDCEVVWSFSVPVMPTGNSLVAGAVLRYSDQSNNVRLHVELSPAGSVGVKIARTLNGAASTLVDTIAVTTAGINTAIWGKARAVGAYVMVKTWVGTRGDEPDEWHASAVEGDLPGSQAGLYPWRFNTNAGTYTFYVDNFELTNILWSGSIPELSPRWPDKSGADSTMPLAGAGILRLLNAGKGIVQSPLRWQLGPLKYASMYLPLEDASGSTSAGSGISWGRAGVVVEGTFASDDTLPGSDACLVLDSIENSYVSVTGVYPPSMNILAANGFAAMILFKCPAVVTAERVLMEIRTVGTVTRWVVYVNGSGYGFRGYDDSGALLADNAANYGSGIPTAWTAIQLEATESGGTVTSTLIWHGVGLTDYLFISDTHSGVCRRITSMTARCAVDGMALAHLWGGDDALPFVDNTFSLVSNGYIGEAAGDRIARLCAEAGLPAVVAAGETEPMGAQKPAKLLDLLRECEDADLGVLYERGSFLGYLPRRARYHPPASLVLDWAAGHLDEPPEPTDDDQRLFNRWTVTRTGGSYAVAEDADSIDAEGPRDNEHEANIASDDRLPDFATWLLSLTTLDELRWPRIQINLVAHPELIPDWLECTIGSRVTIANPPSQILGSSIDLVIEGWTQTINVNRWTVELTCSPAKIWNVGVWSDTATPSSKYQTATGRLSADATSSQVFLSTVADSVGSTYSVKSTPYDLVCEGHRVTVTRASQPGSIQSTLDGSFEAGTTTGWSASNGTVAASSAQAWHGTYSALLTVTGTPTATHLRPSSRAPVVAGETYRTRMWLYSPTGITAAVSVDWYNSGGTYLSTTSSNIVLAAATWTAVDTAHLAPATATTASYGPSMGGSPATGTQLYADDIDMSLQDGTNQTLWVTREPATAKALSSGSPLLVVDSRKYGL